MTDDRRSLWQDVPLPAELTARTAALLTAVDDDSGRVLVLEGTPGSGRRALVARAADQLGGRLLAGTPPIVEGTPGASSTMDGTLALLPVPTDRAITRAFERLGPHPASSAGALLATLLGTSEVPDTHIAWVEAELSDTTRPVWPVLGQLLRRLAEERPTIVQIADVTHISAPSAQALATLATETPGLSLVLGLPLGTGEPWSLGALPRTDTLRMPVLSRPTLLAHHTDSLRDGAAADPDRLGPLTDDVLERADGSAVLAGSVLASQRLANDAPKTGVEILLDHPGAPTELSSFFEAAALCGGVMPMPLIGRALDLDPARTEAVVDFLDDHAVEPAWLQDHAYHHPSFPGLAVYGVPDLDALLAPLHGMPVTRRRHLARRLLAAAREVLPPITRGAVHLLMSLHEHGEEEDGARSLARQLASWISAEPDEDLTPWLANRDEDDRIAMLARVATETRTTWPAERRILLLERLYDLRHRQTEVDRAVLLNLYVGTLRELGRATDAISVGEQAITEIEEALGPEDRLSGLAHVTFAAALQDAGDHERARHHLTAGRRALEGSGSDEDRAVVEERLAAIAMSGQQLEGAREHLQRAHDLLVASHGRAHPRLSGVLKHLANVEEKLHHFRAARDAYEQALTVEENIEPVDEEAVLVLAKQVGETSRQLDEPEKAIPAYRKALAIESRLRPPPSLPAARLQEQIADLAAGSGDAAVAADHFRLAIEGYEHLLGPDSKTVARLARGLAFASLRQNAPETARQQLERALAIDALHGRDETPTFSSMLKHLATLECMAGELAAARAHYTHALGIDSQLHGARSQPVLDLHKHIGQLAIDLGDRRIAIEHFERALEIEEHRSGQRSLAVSDLHKHIGQQALEIEDYQGAHRAYRRALEIEDGHPEAASDSVSNLQRALDWLASKLGDLQGAPGYDRPAVGNA